jgi:hypothetical protein
MQIIKMRPLEFNVDDKVFLKVSPLKYMLRFGMKRKLAPRYIGPFKVTEITGLCSIQIGFTPTIDQDS